ncbi:hypothetical protein [Dysgonomonas sp. 520]|uniref:hypothetical protein n=1 Tax=Dysgonomonas sp. 520 TaxID=2302931 RepID=UPI0013D575E8|nr:hypothetical protein [Dysgonomonas sp. 520]NDW10949.1 hypothetical protein [Dysgonomonas sp. 520]
MTKKTTSLPDGVTEEMVTKWKEDFGSNNVKKANLVDKDGVYCKSVVVKVPQRKELSESEKWSFSNPDKSKEILVNACVLSHKEEVKADNQLFFSAWAAINELSPLAKATVEDL